jgi:NAD(P)-dependent dehydrogenase (short-subunit alcohol dehydrogenase family)
MERRGPGAGRQGHESRTNPGDRLIDKAALVTGASSGIGEATATALHAEGASVALVGRRRVPLEALATQLGERALAISADVSDEAAVVAAIEQAWEQLGPLHVVVNSAGICVPYRIAASDGDSWHETIATNLSGTYFVARTAGLRMRQGSGGTIVNLGSEMGVLGAAGYAAYCASKAGVAGLTRALAAEFAPRVTVNAVSPGPVDTPMLRAELALNGDRATALEQEIGRIPLKRLGRASDVARAIVFLATDAGYATGMSLALDGGTTVV